MLLKFILLHTLFLCSALHSSQSPLDIFDINALVIRHLLERSDNLTQAVHDVKSLSLITRNSVFFISQQNAVDSIASILSHKFKINKPLVMQKLNMQESKQWLTHFQKAINADGLLAQALINDDETLAMEALNVGAGINSFNVILAAPALIYTSTGTNPEMVRFLMRNGGTIDIRGENGETAFIAATKSDNAADRMKMINVLDEFHPDKTIKDNNGLTAIDWAMLRS